MTEKKVLNKGIEGEITDRDLEEVVGGVNQKGNRNTGLSHSFNDNSGNVTIGNNTRTGSQSFNAGNGSLNVEFAVKNDVNNNSGDVIIKSPVKIDNKGGGNININL
ncbi:MAG: hypothetical protein ACI3ZR_04105 [bacterium]